MRRVLELLAILVLLFPPAAAVGASEPYDINVITSLTGAFAFAGQAVQQALRAFERKVNKDGGVGGRPIRFVIHDDESIPQTAVQFASELISANVPVIIGPSSVTMCRAITPLVKDGPVSYCMSGALRPPSGSYQFSAMMSADNFIVAAIRYARYKGVRRIAVIVGNDSSGQDGERGFDAAMALSENKGLTVVDREHFNVADITVAAQLARIKAQAPDLLFAWTTGTPVATVLRGVKELGMDKIPVIISSGNASYAQMKQYTPFLPKEVLLGVPAGLVADQITQPALKAAVQDCVDTLASVGTKPDTLVLTGYDPALLIVAAIKKIGIANVTADRIRAYIAGLNRFAGCAGVYNFHDTPQRGLDEKQTYVARWDVNKQDFVGVSKAGGVPIGIR